MNSPNLEAALAEQRKRDRLARQPKTALGYLRSQARMDVGGRKSLRVYKQDVWPDLSVAELLHFTVAEANDAQRDAEAGAHSFDEYQAEVVSEWGRR